VTRKYALYYNFSILIALNRLMKLNHLNNLPLHFLEYEQYTLSAIVDALAVNREGRRCGTSFAHTTLLPLKSHY
jgi:hypothetical protein